MNMTRERQTAANRRNARKSTGPRSGAGKRRAARNSLKHGLATSIITDTSSDPLIDKLAARIADKGDGASIRQCARDIVAAELELDRIRRIRIGLIEGARLPNGAAREPGERPSEQGANTTALASAIAQNDSSQRFDQTADAVRRVLPELARIVRYERRAVTKRDNAVRRLLQLRRCWNQQEP